LYFQSTEGHRGAGPAGEGGRLGITAPLAGVALGGCPPSGDEEEEAILTSSLT